MRSIARVTSLLLASSATCSLAVATAASTRLSPLETNTLVVTASDGGAHPATPYSSPLLAQRHGDDNEEHDGMSHQGHGHATDHQDDDMTLGDTASSSSSLSSSPTLGSSNATDSHAHSSGGGGGGHHHTKGPAKTEFNETDVIRAHGHTPISYLHYDWSLSDEQRQVFLQTGLSPAGNVTTDVYDLDQQGVLAWQKAVLRQAGKQPGDYILDGDGASHKYLFVSHFGLMLLAYWIILPIILALRAAKYQAPVTELALKAMFGVSAFSAWVTMLSYQSLTPEL